MCNFPAYLVLASLQKLPEGWQLLSCWFYGVLGTQEEAYKDQKL